MLHKLCNIAIRNRLEAESGYQDVVEKNSFNAMILCQLVKIICNGSTSVELEGIVGKMVEALCSYMLIKCDDYPLFSQCLKSLD